MIPLHALASGYSVLDAASRAFNPATLADAAETWARARGLRVPARGTPTWTGMFSAWQRSGMSANPCGSDTRGPNPELLIVHLAAAESVALLLASWGWSARVVRRPGGWIVDTNAAPSHVAAALERTRVALETLPPTSNPLTRREAESLLASEHHRRQTGGELVHYRQVHGLGTSPVAAFLFGQAAGLSDAIAETARSRPVRERARRRVQRAQTGQDANLGLGVTGRPPRTPNRSSFPDGEFSAHEATLGSRASARTAPFLAVLEQGFAGGRAFSRDDLAREGASIRGASGQHLSPGSVAVRAGHALSELERLGYVERVGKTLGRTGRPGPMMFTLTQTGEQRALAQQDADAFAFGENVVAAQVAALEAQLPPARGGAPLSGPTYRPSLEVLATRGHKLPALQNTRIKAAGYKTCNPARSKKCRLGLHDFEPATGLCRRAGCEAFHHAGQATLFGRDLDPVAVAEALARQRATGQGEMFTPNPDEDVRELERLALASGDSTLWTQLWAAQRRIGERPRLTRPEAYRRLESAGIRVWTSSDGTKHRIYEPGRDGAYLILKPGFHDDRWSDYPDVKVGSDSARVSGGFHGRVRDILEAVRLANPILDPRDPGPSSKLVFATVTGKNDVALARRFGTPVGRGRFSFTRDAWGQLIAAKNGRTANPLSVLVLNSPPAGSRDARAPRPAATQNPVHERGPAPPPGTPGVDLVRAHVQMFHDAPGRVWKTIDIPDGKKGVTHKAVSALGLTEATVYSAPWRASNKHKAGVYEHVHETRKPLETFDPVTNTTMKILVRGSGPSDWWRDDRDALTATQKARRTA